MKADSSPARRRATSSSSSLATVDERTHRRPVPGRPAPVTCEPGGMADLIETLRTTGAVRDFLPDPVDDVVVARILDAARFAPSGGNGQGWHVVVVQDAAKRARLRDLYLP